MFLSFERTDVKNWEISSGQLSVVEEEDEILRVVWHSIVVSSPASWTVFII